MIIPATTNEERAVLASYLASKIGTTPQELVGHMPFVAAKVVRGTQPMGAVMYTNYRMHSMEFSAAGEPGWMTRATIRQMFSYPFEQLQVWTLLALIKRTNATARTISRSLGFQELCVIRSGAERSEDIILYGMERDKCPWIEGKRGASRRKRTSELNGAAAIESSALTSNIGVP